MSGFGCSVSCIIEGIKTTSKIRRAFQEAGGAKEQYANTLAFLKHLEVTLKHLKKHIEHHTTSEYNDAVEEGIKLIDKFCGDLELVCLEKYERA